MSKFGELISANVPVLFNFFTNWNEDTVAMNEVLRNVAAALGLRDDLAGPPIFFQEF